MNKFLFIVLILASCRTIKYVEKEKTVIDSSLVEQNEGLQRTLHETVVRHEAERASWEHTGVVFDTIRLPGDTVISRVTFFDNGKLKSAEGRLLAVNLDLQEKDSEILNAHSTIDSLALELEKKEARLNKKTETLVKEVRRTVWPWWLFAICLIAGMAIEFKFRLLTKTLKFMRFIPFIALAFLAGCVDQKNAPGTSIWAGGLWVLPILTGLGALFFGYKAFAASRSGSQKQNKDTGVTTYSDKNIPIYKTGSFYFACGLALITLIIIYMVYSDR